MSKDWRQWHRHYDRGDPSLLQRLETVRDSVRRVLSDAHRGEDGVTHITSICAGDGRDLLPVLSGRGAGTPVRAILVELDPVVAQRAREVVASLGLSGVEIRVADGGLLDTYWDIPPADVLLACGIFGNISTRDVERTVASLPALMAADGIVIWTRGAENQYANRGDDIRNWFADHGFSEMSFRSTPDGVFRIGVHRLVTDRSADRVFGSGARMFEFL